MSALLKPFSHSNMLTLDLSILKYIAKDYTFTIKTCNLENIEEEIDMILS